MDYEKYRDIIMNGERVEWYGQMVPKDLITESVKYSADMMIGGIRKMEREIDDSRGEKKESKKRYLESLWNNLRNLPYTDNHDVYMKKRKRIEAEMEELEKKKPKPRKPRKKKTVDTKPTEKKVVKRRTKNSKLIFGNKNE